MKIAGPCLLILWGCVGMMVPPFDWQSWGCVLLAAVGFVLFLEEVRDARAARR